MIPNILKDRLLAIPGVLSVGLSLAGVEVHIKKGTNIPSEIDGIKLIVVETNDSPELVNYIGDYDPLRPGVMLSGGSVGFFVEWRGHQYAITASHLWGPGRWKAGEMVVHMGRIVGLLSKWVPYTTGTNPREVLQADIASVSLLPGVKCSNRLIDGDINLKGIAKPQLGQPVFVVGRWTGMAGATITHVDMSVNIGGDFRLENAFQVDKPLIPGDSGGLVCSADGQVLGLITATTSKYGTCTEAVAGLKALGMADAELVREPDTVIELPIGQAIMTVNGRVQSIDVPAQIIAGRTMVPLRVISEALGAEVDWEPKDGKVEKVFITRGG